MLQLQAVVSNSRVCRSPSGYNHVPIDQNQKTKKKEKEVIRAESELSIAAEQFSDCWDIEYYRSNPYIHFNEHTIRLKKNQPHWISCFGAKIVTKGEYKRWQITVKSNKARSENLWRSAARVMIGVVDVATMSERERGKPIKDEFWRRPRFGYALSGETGNIYHLDKEGKAYCPKIKLGDTVTVELNRTSNPFILHNDLRFFINGKVHGMAYTVEAGRNYALAVAVCSDKYDVSISS